MEMLESALQIPLETEGGPANPEKDPENGKGFFFFFSLFFFSENPFHPHPKTFAQLGGPHLSILLNRTRSTAWANGKMGTLKTMMSSFRSKSTKWPIMGASWAPRLLGGIDTLSKASRTWTRTESSGRRTSPGGASHLRAV